MQSISTALLGQYQREGDNLLGRIFAMGETWAHHTNQAWNANQTNEVSWFSSYKESAP